MKYYRLNNKITAPQVCLITENGEHLGNVDINKALELAQKKGLDLVEIGPRANPPVVKILDFGQFKYDSKKKDREQKKQSKTDMTKGIRLTPRIGKHDLEFRKDKAKSFLAGGNKVKIEMILKGREKAHFDLAEEKLKEFINFLSEESKIDQQPKRQGSRLTALISPIK